MQANHPIFKDAIREYKRTIKYLLIFSLATNALMLAMPLYSMQIFDRVFSSYSIDTLLILSLIVVIAMVMFGIIYGVRQAVCSQISEWLEREISPVIFKHTIEQTALRHSPTGTQNMRDLVAIKSFITSPGFQTLLDLPWTPVFLIIIFAVSPLLGFATTLGGGVLLVLAYITEIATKSTNEDISKQAIEAMRLSDAANRNAETIEAMGMMSAVLARWHKLSTKLILEQSRTAMRSDTISSFSKVVRMLIQVFITGLGGFLVLENMVSSGGMIAVSILSGRALAPLEAVIGLWKSVFSVRDSYKRLDAELSRPRPMRGDMKLPAPSGRLLVENVYFKPHGSEQMILRGVRFAVEPGTSLGIIGPSAAGKSTLTKLLAGIWPCTSGTVRLDGADMFQWNRDDIGNYVGYLPQDVEMFEATIRDNIARLRPDASDAAVVDAAKVAGVHEMILRLPNGYETFIREGLATLSPGQKQRIALARALYAKPRLIVMDEPNSNLDGEGEIALANALRRLKEHHITCIIVAHKPSIVAQMDKIMMLRGGVVEAFGDRDEILPRYMGAPKISGKEAENG